MGLKLSKRLMALAQMVPGGARVADIGTDHAFLPCYLVREKSVPYVIGVDVHQGPYERAQQTVQEAHLQDKIELRLGDGLAVIKAGEVELVVIAGMGGTAIRGILERAPHVISKLQKLILQPMNNAEMVRFWLQEHDWCITNEELIYEDKQYYQIIGAKPALAALNVSSGSSPFGGELEAAYGPLLIQNRHPLLPELLNRDLEGLQIVLQQLAQSTQEDAQLRYREYTQRMQKIKRLKEKLVDYLEGGKI